MKCRTRARHENAGSHARSVIHSQAEDYIEATFGDFDHGNAFLCADGGGCDSLERWDVEATIPFAELLFFVPAPSS
jgi:hypothetical protein